MLYIITIIMIILNLLYRDSKKVYCLSFFYCFIMLAFSYGSYDTLIFINRYLHPERYYEFTEILFNAIVMFFNKLKVSYMSFMVMISLIEITLIFNFIKRHSLNNCYVIGLFILYPMLVWFEQLRYLMAFTIVLTCGVECLISKPKHYRVKAFLFIIMATLIHSSSIFWIVLLVAEYLDLKKIKLLTFCSLFMMLLVGVSPDILKLVEMFIGEEKTRIITTLTKLQDGKFGCTVLSACVFLEYIVFYKYVQKRKEFLGLTEKDNIYLDEVYKFNIISIISIPLIWMFTVAFMRIATSLLLLNYIGFSKVMSYKKKMCTTKEKFTITIIVVTYTIMLLIFNIHTEEAVNLILKPFFEQNILWNFIKIV